MKSITAILALVLLSSSAHANPCKSQWMKTREAFANLGPIVGQIVCSLTAETPEDAQRCVVTYEMVVATIKTIEAQYNQRAGSAAIGPRGLGPNKAYTGNVIAERVFVGTPVMSDTWKLDFKITGGKAQKDLKVDVCLIDPGSNKAVANLSKTFSAPPKAGTRWTPKLKKAFGKLPMVYLRKPAGTKGFKYTLTSKPGKKDPKVVRQARKTAASSSPSTSKTKRSTLPSVRR